MHKYNLSGEKRTTFAYLTNHVVAFLKKSGYIPGDQTSGYALGNFSKEHVTIEFVDTAKNQVLLYDYQRVNGAYHGMLHLNLPPSQSDELEKKITLLLSELSPEYQTKRATLRK